MSFRACVYTCCLYSCISVCLPPYSFFFFYSYHTHIYMYKLHFFSHVGMFFSVSREFFLVLSAAGHAGDPRVQRFSASLGPGWASWRVLWASKAALAGYFPRDCVPQRRATQDQGNPTISAFIALLLLLLVHHTVPQALKLSTLWQPRYSSSRTSNYSSLCDGG